MKILHKICRKENVPNDRDMVNEAHVSMWKAFESTTSVETDELKLWDANYNCDKIRNYQWHEITWNDIDYYYIKYDIGWCSSKHTCLRDTFSKKTKRSTKKGVGEEHATFPLNIDYYDFL